MSDEATPADTEPAEDEPTEVTQTDDLLEVSDDTRLPDPPPFSVMSIESVLFDLSDASPMVHLIEEEPPYRYLAIPIALPEALALHSAIDKIEGRRPGTHEVMSEVLRRLNADVVSARITRYEGGVFYAELNLMTSRGHEVFDCRTSDALIVAMRQGVRAPVLCAESVFHAFYE